MGPTGPVYPKTNPLTMVVPPIETPPTPSDSERQTQFRPSLQQVVQRTLRGEASFREVHFVVYSRREPGGRIGGPRDVYGNRELLLGHSDYLDDLLLGHPKEDVPLPASVRKSSQTIEADVYGYGDDSDLESMDGDYDEADYGSEVSTAPSSLSSNGSDAPVMVDASPPLGSHRSISTAEAAAPIHITDTAAKTWECLIYYLYTGEVHFNRSLRHAANDLSDTMHCSPKSMYRLADKVGLPDLMGKCEDNLMEGLSESNIIQELSSTFTSKYEDVQTAQIDRLFTKCFADDNVRVDLNKLNRETLAGKHPHAHGVLADIFEQLSAGYWRDKAATRDDRSIPGLPSRERSSQGSFTNLDPSETSSVLRPESEIRSEFDYNAHTRPSTRAPSRVQSYACGGGPICDSDPAPLPAPDPLSSMLLVFEPRTTTTNVSPPKPARDSPPSPVDGDDDLPVSPAQEPAPIPVSATLESQSEGAAGESSTEMTAAPSPVTEPEVEETSAPQVVHESSGGWGLGGWGTSAKTVPSTTVSSWGTVHAPGDAAGWGGNATGLGGWGGSATGLGGWGAPSTEHTAVVSAPDASRGIQQPPEPAEAVPAFGGWGAKAAPSTGKTAETAASLKPSLGSAHVSELKSSAPTYRSSGRFSTPHTRKIAESGAPPKSSWGSTATFEMTSSRAAPSSRKTAETSTPNRMWGKSEVSARRSRHGGGDKYFGNLDALEPALYNSSKSTGGQGAAGAEA